LAVETIISVIGLSFFPGIREMQANRTPTLVIEGEHSPFAKFTNPQGQQLMVSGQDLARLLGGQYALVEGAGHIPHCENSQGTAKVIFDFVQQAG